VGDSAPHAIARVFENYFASIRMIGKFSFCDNADSAKLE